MNDAYKTERKAVQVDTMWNADTIGPAYFCIYCFHENKDYPAYCSHCGHVSTIYKAPSDVKKFTRCHNHKDKNAVGWCALCAKPICEICDSEGKKPDDYFDYTVNLKCKTCVEESNRLQQEHEQHVIAEKACSRHEEIDYINKCTTCGTQMCSNCSYGLVTIKGRFFKSEEVTGPYCLLCLRQARVEKTSSNSGSWKPYEADKKF